MLVYFDTTKYGPTPDMARREFNKISRGAWGDAGVYWHQMLRPKHFTHAGATEYGYAKRAGVGLTGKAFRASYTGRKLRKYGHTYPLVLTGESKVRTATLGRVYATRDSARVTMNAPALNFWHRKMTPGLDMAAEMTTISDPERGELIGVLDEGFEGRLRSFEGRKDAR
jgi:hypothetical protein